MTKTSLSARISSAIARRRPVGTLAKNLASQAVRIFGGDQFSVAAGSSTSQSRNIASFLSTASPPAKSDD